MIATETTVLESIADELESWGDGWRRIHGEPSDRDRRLTIFRQSSDDIRTEIMVHLEAGQWFVFVCSILERPRYSFSSFSIRNPANRRALDYVNRVLDKLDQ